MVITSLSSQEFAQDVYTSLRDTDKGPVFITDCGVPTHVLLSHQSYQDLLQRQRNIAVSLGMPGAAEVDFNPSPCNIQLRDADLT